MSEEFVIPKKLKLKKGDIVLVRARVVEADLDYDGVACTVESFEGDIELEPDQVFVAYPLDIVEKIAKDECPEV